MEFPAASRILMILILPFLIFLAVFDFAGLDESYFRQKFPEYGITDAALVGAHEKILKFVTGKGIELPDGLNERERQHLADVRRLINYAEILLYALIAIFMVLLAVSAVIIKINRNFIDFIGKVLLFGGSLTIFLGLFLFLMVKLDFSSAFENFHLLLFQKGTYTFDPASDLLVNIYPGQLFMDIGIRISKGVFFASVFSVLLGAFLALKPKKGKKLKTK
ncbi:DUF1461 domain-containing protein [Candidatus Woesearchaeota archaeon]|nr:DUF1461 domain-containing protein [Candidatus Woesearchaeota archaeon]